jgi:pantoate--beta-alanine ligase
MAQVITDIALMQQAAAHLRAAGKRIAVVPTMGALHEGHLTLIREAAQRADTVITTVFVNPTQFGPGEDFAKYPRMPERDAALAAGAGAAYVFAPSAPAMYPQGYATFVNVERITEVLEGKSRPGHFRGVATVVLKLFAVTQPHVAVFGQKDAQQVAVIRRMIRDLHQVIELVVVPTVRESDGLAMSSRNAYLSADERAQATVLYRALEDARKLVEAGERRCDRLLDSMNGRIAGSRLAAIDYLSVADADSLEELRDVRNGQTVLISLAVRFGRTRLIDNILVEVR